MDVRSDRLSEVLGNEGVTHVAHLAYVVNPTRNPNVEYDIDIGGTRNVLNACRQTGVRCLTVASSIAAYGWHADNPLPIPESTPLRGNLEFPYARNKVVVERDVAEYSEKNRHCRVCVLRICNVLGPHVHNAISFALTSPLFLAARGYDPFLAFTHEDDMAEVFRRVLVEETAGVFNVAGAGMLRLSEVLRITGQRVLHLPHAVLRGTLEILFRVHWLPFGSGQIGFIEHSCVPDISKLTSELRYVPRYTSEQTLGAFIRSRSTS